MAKNSNKVKRKHKKYTTRNILPDLLRVSRVLLIGFLFYTIILTVDGRLIPYLKGYSMYTCSKDYSEVGYFKGDTLILKKGVEGIYLFEIGDREYIFSDVYSDESIGAVVHSFNMFKSIVHIYNSIVSSLNSLD